MDGPSPAASETVNILLVDDQPAKLLSYETILQQLGQNLLKAGSGREALQILLRNDVAVILADVCMPDLDGFELAQIVREHPRFKETAIIFVSAINVSETDSLKGYALGGVDYVSVPVVPDVLRAKVRVFVDLYLKTRALAHLNAELEQRVVARTAELEAAVARQELLAREIDHRARNMLAVIQSMVTLTPCHDGPLYASAIKGRLKAMATAHNLLSESRWRGANLHKLVSEELAPFESAARIVVDGEPVSIDAAVAQSLALALHELATNAAKHGAFRHEEGRLRVQWKFADDFLVLDWIEEGGSALCAPKSSGFGSRVIDGSIRGQLGGEIERTWRPSGFACSMRLPLRHFISQTQAVEPIAHASEPVIRAPAPGRRVLVVEDEPYIALMTSQYVSELGGEVLGPFSSIAEARSAVEGAFDLALLDVNVAGEISFEFADELERRGVNVVFLTGYQSDLVTQRFASAAVLTKPIQREDLEAVLEGPR